jgi:hypothetical protein
MGLLDDAIREHMELKRLRGADPSEVAREEQDALGPVGRENDGVTQAPRDDVAASEEISHEDSALGEDDSPRTPQPARGPDFANVGQETAELDMRTVLDGEQDAQDASSATRVGAGPAENDSGEHPRDEDPLEWEMPGDSSREAMERPRSHEGVEGDGGPTTAGGAEDAQEPVEDVLEETPDFLRDTPEQERLWFEQRPPRDFDFDK